MRPSSVLQTDSAQVPSSLTPYSSTPKQYVSVSHKARQVSRRGGHQLPPKYNKGGKAVLVEEHDFNEKDGQSISQTNEEDEEVFRVF